MRAVFTLLLIALLSGCAAPPSCDLVRLAEMPLEVRNNLLFVTAWIGNQPVRLAIDTGATRTTLTENAERRLRLPHDPRAVTRSVGIGGISAARDVVIPGIVLGHTRFPVPRLAVADFSLDHGGPPRIDGLLGADILLAFDLDIDIPARRVTLYRVRECPGAVPPWPEPAIRISGVRTRRDRLLVPFRLDGVGGMAILDTGAQGSAISTHMADRLGLTRNVLQTDREIVMHGVAPDPVAVHVHRFAAMEIGDMRIAAPVLAVLPDTAGTGDGLLGADFLHGRRVWLSFATRRLFVTAPRGAASMPRP